MTTANTVGNNATTTTIDSSNSNNNGSFFYNTGRTAATAATQSNSNNNILPLRASYYESNYPLYSFDWTNTINSNNNNKATQSIVFSTYREDLINKLQVINNYTSENGDMQQSNNSSNDDYNFRRVAETDVTYPATKVLWDPKIPEHGVQRFASSSQYLQLWQLEEDHDAHSAYNNASNYLSNRGHLGNYPVHRISEKLKLMNSKLDQNSLPPLTSFDWNTVNINYILTCSIDTTCTLWDLTKQAVKTQLIAHDSEVYDVKFIHNDLNTFFSVGADGSVRLFDLRSLEHSTIIYEPPQTLPSNPTISTTTTPAATTAPGNEPTVNSQFPLLRLDTCKTNQNIIATVGLNSNLVYILDMRYPGNPTFILNGHSASVNSIAWHPNKQILLSGSDDCQALIWDLSDLNNLHNSGSARQRGVANVSGASGATNGNVSNTGQITTNGSGIGSGGRLISSEFQKRLVQGGTVSWKPALGGINSINNNINNTANRIGTNNSGITSVNNNSSNYMLRSNIIEYPDYSYCDPLEINNVRWNKVGDWFGVVSGKGFQGVKTY